jgi:uncharacterized protein (DUF58 family)
LNHFDPKVLAKLKRLSLRARTVVDGMMVGIHPSRSKGLSAEFEEHRGYSQGDEIRHVDWKAYAKFDRYFLKEYREATNLKAWILVDTSASMRYASNGLTKFDYGCTLGASLAYLMLKQQDAVGFALFAEKIEKMIPAKATHGHFFDILREMENRTPEGKTQAGRVLQEMAAGLKRRGLIVLISDLLDDSREVIKGFKQLRSRGNDILVFQVLDRDELNFPFTEPLLLRDMEEDLQIRVDPLAARAAYLKAIQSLIAEYRGACAAQRIDYALLDTSVSLDQALVRYLTWRERFRL